MTSFTATGILTTTQLLASGEVGFVTRNGAVLTTTGLAVQMQGAAQLMVFGSMATGGATAISGVNLSSAHITIAESGMVVGGGGTGFAANFTGASSVVNDGQLSGLYGTSLLCGGNLALENAGLLQGSAERLARGVGATVLTDGNLYLNNSGTISATGSAPTAVYLQGEGTASIINSGTISVSSPLSDAINAVITTDLVNTGTILGWVTMVGRSTITSSGTISGNVTLGGESDVVKVSGLVDGTVSLGAGTNTFTLAGGQVTGKVIGGSGNDSYVIDRSDVKIQDVLGGVDGVTSSASYQLTDGIESLYLAGPVGLTGIGSLLANTIRGTAGDDRIFGMGGDDSLYGGDGDNLLNGGSGNDSLSGGDGDDRLRGAAGDDVLFFGVGDDTLGGGSGVDLLYLAALGSPTPGGTVNLTTGNAGISGVATGRLFDIENVRGTIAGDAITGDAGINMLDGAEGDDTLTGAGGDDLLVGGRGADSLNGGAGADRFVFAAKSDSATADGIDLIAGFVKGADKIDLSAIDAVAGGGDDAFAFVGTAGFAGAGAQVRYVRDTGAGTTTVEVRLANAASVDMVIVLDSLVTLAAGDFAL